ncbi:MAG: ABC transporter permease [Ruminiclostridium sp.]|nr:ABC transporter permease [Ruminiclostridium sp.]
MEIFKWEMRKIWRRKSTKLVIIFAVGYVIFSAVFNGVVNLGSSNGNNPDGVRRIAEQYEFAELYKGDMTEEKLLEVYERIQAAYAPENIIEFPDGSNGISNENRYKYIEPIKVPAGMIMNLCRMIPEYENIYSLTNIPKNVAEDFYGLREKATNNFISSQVLNEKDRQFFLKQNLEVKTPFYYDWFEGQSVYLEIMSPIPIIIALFITVFISPICALEYQQKTDSVILCSKHGRKKLALAKLSASVIFSSAVYIICMGIYIAGQLFFCGTRALNCPIQLIKHMAIAPLTILQAEIYLIVLGFLSCLAITAVTFLLSSAINLVFPVAAASMMLIIIPMLLSGAIPESLSFITVLPFMSDYTEIYRTNIYFHIWSPYLMIAVPILIFIICAPFAVWKFRTHQTSK